MASKTAAPGVPASQKVEKVPETIFNDAFAQKAEALKPQLQQWIDQPLSVIEFEPDKQAYFKCRAVPKQTIEELSSRLRVTSSRIPLFPSRR
jgi:alpha-L-rhamnosidase